MSGDMQAFQDRGEPWRQMFGIDGTAGDAQDREHPFVPDSPGGCCVVCGMARAYRKHTGDFAEPPPPADFYDEHEDMFPALIRNSRWSCLDCPEPSGEPWESITDYCAPAACHHHATGHRVNGSVEVRYRAQTLPPVVAGRGAADGTPDQPDVPEMTGAWWLCPNTPPCPHGAVLHDIYDPDDQSPTCCADGCTCGGAR